MRSSACIALAAGAILLGHAQPASPAGDGLVLTADGVSSFTYPFDKHIHRTVSLSNPTGATVTGRFFIRAVLPGGVLRDLSTSFPRNNFLTMAPGETVTLVVSALWDELDTSAWHVGGTYVQTIRIDVLAGSLGTQQRLDLANRVTVRAPLGCEPRCTAPRLTGKPNGTIVGRITDGGGRGLAGVNVEVTAPNSASVPRRVLTRRDGSFKTAVWTARTASNARWTSFSVRATAPASRRLQTRGTVVTVQPGRPADVRLVLPARTERASYTLASTTSLDAPPYAGSVDDAGGLFAVAPYDVEGPGAVIRAIAASGTTVWTNRLTAGVGGPLAVAPDGTLVAAATHWHGPNVGAETILFDRAGSEVGRFWIDGNRSAPDAVHTEVASLRFSPDSKRLFVGTGDGSWFMYDVASLSPIWRGEVPRGLVIGRVAAFSPDGSRLYFGAGDGYLRAVDAATGAPVWRQWIGGVTFSLAVSSTRVVASGQSGFLTYVLDAVTGTVVAQYPQEYHANDVAISSDGSHVYLAGGADADGECMALNGSLRPLWDLGDPCASVATTADGRHVVVAGSNFVALLSADGDVLWRAAFPDAVAAGRAPKGFVWIGDGDTRIVVVSPYTSRVYVYTGAITG